MKKEITLLVVDDDSEQINILIKCLNTYANITQYFEANNGKQALEIIKHQDNIDLVISDIQMPELTGIELLKEIKNIRPQLPVLLVTGNYAYTKEYVKEHGGYDLLYKPYSLNKLVQLIRSAIMMSDFNSC